MALTGRVADQTLIQTAAGTGMSRPPARCPAGPELGGGQVLVGPQACAGHGHPEGLCRLAFGRRLAISQGKFQRFLRVRGVDKTTPSKGDASPQCGRARAEWSDQSAFESAEEGQGVIGRHRGERRSRRGQRLVLTSLTSEPARAPSCRVPA